MGIYLFVHLFDRYFFWFRRLFISLSGVLFIIHSFFLTSQYPFFHVSFVPLRSSMWGSSKEVHSVLPFFCGRILNFFLLLRILEGYLSFFIFLHVLLNHVSYVCYVSYSRTIRLLDRGQSPSSCFIIYILHCWHTLLVFFLHGVGYNLAGGLGG